LHQKLCEIPQRPGWHLTTAFPRLGVVGQKRGRNSLPADLWQELRPLFPGTRSTGWGTGPTVPRRAPGPCVPRFRHDARPHAGGGHATRRPHGRKRSSPGRDECRIRVCERPSGSRTNGRGHGRWHAGCVWVVTPRRRAPPLLDQGELEMDVHAHVSDKRGN